MRELGALFYQAEDGIRDLVRSRGLGDVYKRQGEGGTLALNDVNITIGIKFMQEFLLKRNLKVFQYLSLIHI